MKYKMVSEPRPLLSTDWESEDNIPQEGAHILCKTVLSQGGGGKARFNVATPTYATVSTAYVLLYNLQTKSILHYFKRGSTLNLDGFSVKIIFNII